MQNIYKMARFINWCFTLHDFTDEEYSSIAWGDFGGLQGETAPDTGRRHLQGFFVMKKRPTLSWLKKNLHAKAHFECMKGTIEQSIAYCSKSDSSIPDCPYRQWGEKPVS